MIHLYIKTHRKTGLKYFGKTERDPFKYDGSGLRWRAHLRKHGREIDTAILGSFADPDEATAVALAFSRANNIVGDPGWANLMEENAKDGAPLGHPGHKFTDEQLDKLADASKKRWQDPTYKERVRCSQQASWTPERHEAHQAWLREHWTTARRDNQRCKMTGRKLGTTKAKGVKKTPQHCANIAAGSKGLKKTPQHCANLSKSLQARSPEQLEASKTKRRSHAKIMVEGVGYGSLRHASEVLGLTPYYIKKLPSFLLCK